jgi:hypothetical protein
MSDKLKNDYDNLLKSIELLQINYKKREDGIKSLKEEYINKKNQLESKFQKIENLLLELQKEVYEVENIKKEIIDDILIKKESINEKEEKKLPYKKFYIRKSLLTELLEKSTYQAIYNIIFSYFIMNVVLYILNLYIEGKKVPINFYIGEYINDYIHFIYYYVIKKLFILIFVILINFTPNSNKTINFLIINFIIVLNLFVFYNQKLLVTINFSLLLKIIFYFDNASSMLKMFGYFFEKKLFLTYKIYCEYNKIEENIPRHNIIIIKDIGNQDNKIEFEFKKPNILNEIKSFQKYCIISTFIYRDEYPKIKGNKKTLNHFFNFIFCLIFIYLLLEICITPLLNDLSNNSNLDISTFAYIYVSFILVSILGFFVLFFGIQHSSGNFTADLCNFGDRYFYSNFYEASTPIELTEKYCYIYIDFFHFYLFQLFKRFLPKNTIDNNYLLLYNIIQFLFIALIVDSIFYFSFGFKFPYLLIFIEAALMLSIPIKNIKGDTKFLIAWNFIISGIGAFTMVIISEIYFSEKKIDFELGNLNKYKNYFPKIFLLLIKNIQKQIKQ